VLGSTGDFLALNGGVDGNLWNLMQTTSEHKVHQPGPMIMIHTFGGLAIGPQRVLSPCPFVVEIVTPTLTVLES